MQTFLTYILRDHTNGRSLDPVVICDEPKYFTAKRAKTAKAHPISENSGDSTVQNFPDSPSGIFTSEGWKYRGFLCAPTARPLVPASFAVQMQCLERIHATGTTGSRRIPVNQILT
jgi:hypothetical protein